ncbi:MAG: hypothetical protein NDJ89_08645 [Oligoflexia bacterium]|nr:hypothetical protein [Oligoflexia bacterium]
MNSNLWRTGTVLCAVAMTAFMGCSKTLEETAVDTSIKISGALSTGTSLYTQNQSTMRRIGIGSGINLAMASLSDLEVYAIAFTTPPVIATADLNDATGAFELTLPGAKGAFISLIFRDKTDYTTVGTVEFVDSSKTDLDGNTKSSTSIAFNDSVSLGSITMSSDGKVQIPVSTVQAATVSTSVSAAVAFDFSGSWTMGAYDGTLPTGYTTTTDSMENGMPNGMPITLIRMAGKAFTPGAGCTEGSCASTDGTIGTEDRFAISIWGGATTPVTLGTFTVPAAITACGDKLGFTAAQARAHGIHLESAPTINGLTIDFGAYTFQTKADFGGDPAPNNEPWMKTGATPRDPKVQNCGPVTITHNSVDYTAWYCESEMDSDDDGTVYETTVYTAGLGGGCFDSASKPVMVDNWSAIYPDNCVSNAGTDLPPGFKSDTCTYTNKDPDGSDGISSGGTAVVNNPAMNFTCTHTFGIFTDSSLTTPYSGSFHQMRPKSTTYATCAEIPDTLPRYRCYAENYWSGGGDGPDGWATCSKRYNFNWAATDPANFVMADGRDKPDAAFLTELIDYLPDGKTAIVEHKEHETRTIGDNGKNVFCQIERMTKLKISQISATKLLVDLQESSQMMDLDNAACVAAAKTEFQKDVKGEKVLFYLNKI